jgi:hypothetical protein
VFLLLGVVINYVLKKYSCRKVGIAGSVVFFIGSFTSAFANSTALLAFAYGVLQGIGVGLMIPAALTSFNNYFLRRRTFAMGVTQVITGIGSMILPILLQKLMEIYGFRGTQMIISAIGLHSLLCAAVQIPATSHTKRKKDGVLNIEESVSEDKGKNRKKSVDAVTSVINRKPQTLKEHHNQKWEYFELRTSDVKEKAETLKEWQASDTHGGMYHDSFLTPDKNISCEHVRGENLIGDSNTRINPVINTNVKSYDQNEFQTIQNISRNPSLVREGQTESTNENISMGTVNEIVTVNGDTNKESQRFVEYHGVKHTKSKKRNVQEEDSANQSLLRIDYLKVRNQPSTDLTSATTENSLSLNSTKSTVTVSGSLSSSCERRITNDETLVLKSVTNIRQPNM